MGPNYCLLRNELITEEIFNVRGEVRNILITSGGSDPYKVIERVLGVVDKVPSLKNIVVPIGPGFGSAEESLREISIKDKRITLLYNETSLSKHFLRSDLVISTAGSTLYELCYLGVPTISLTVADNQVKIAEVFQQLGLIPSIACHHNIEHDLLNKFQEFDKEKRLLVSQKCLSVVDGRGKYRILEELEIVQ